MYIHKPFSILVVIYATLHHTDIYYIPVSGLAGTNLKEHVDTAVCPWYK